jgi:hypothetical protein
MARVSYVSAFPITVEFFSSTGVSNIPGVPAVFFYVPGVVVGFPAVLGFPALVVFPAVAGVPAC